MTAVLEEIESKLSDVYNIKTKPMTAGSDFDKTELLATLLQLYNPVWTTTTLKSLIGVTKPDSTTANKNVSIGLQKKLKKWLLLAELGHLVGTETSGFLVGKKFARLVTALMDKLERVHGIQGIRTKVRGIPKAGSTNNTNQPKQPPMKAVDPPPMEEKPPVLPAPVMKPLEDATNIIRPNEEDHIPVGKQIPRTPPSILVNDESSDAHPDKLVLSANNSPSAGNAGGGNKVDSGGDDSHKLTLSRSVSLRSNVSSRMSSFYSPSPEIRTRKAMREARPKLDTEEFAQMLGISLHSSISSEKDAVFAKDSPQPNSDANSEIVVEDKKKLLLISNSNDTTPEPKKVQLEDDPANESIMKTPSSSDVMLGAGNVIPTGNQIPRTPAAAGSGVGQHQLSPALHDEEAKSGEEEKTSASLLKPASSSNNRSISVTSENLSLPPTPSAEANNMTMANLSMATFTPPAVAIDSGAIANKEEASKLTLPSPSYLPPPPCGSDLPAPPEPSETSSLGSSTLPLPPEPLDIQPQDSSNMPLSLEPSAMPPQGSSNLPLQPPEIRIECPIIEVKDDLNHQTSKLTHASPSSLSTNEPAKERTPRPSSTEDAPASPVPGMQTIARDLKKRNVIPTGNQIPSTPQLERCKVIVEPAGNYLMPEELEPLAIPTAEELELLKAKNEAEKLQRQLEMAAKGVAQNHDDLVHPNGRKRSKKISNDAIKEKCSRPDQSKNGNQNVMASKRKDSDLKKEEEKRTKASSTACVKPRGREPAGEQLPSHEPIGTGQKENTSPNDRELEHREQKGRCSDETFVVAAALKSSDELDEECNKFYDLENGKCKGSNLKSAGKNDDSEDVEVPFVTGTNFAGNNSKSKINSKTKGVSQNMIINDKTKSGLNKTNAVQTSQASKDDVPVTSSQDRKQTPICEKSIKSRTKDQGSCLVESANSFVQPAVPQPINKDRNFDGQQRVTPADTQVIVIAPPSAFKDAGNVDAGSHSVNLQMETPLVAVLKPARTRKILSDIESSVQKGATTSDEKNHMDISKKTYIETSRKDEEKIEKCDNKLKVMKSAKQNSSKEANPDIATPDSFSKEQNHSDNQDVRLSKRQAKNREKISQDCTTSVEVENCSQNSSSSGTRKRSSRRQATKDDQSKQELDHVRAEEIDEQLPKCIDVDACSQAVETDKQTRSSKRQEVQEKVSSVKNIKSKIDEPNGGSKKLLKVIIAPNDNNVKNATKIEEKQSKIEPESLNQSEAATERKGAATSSVSRKNEKDQVNNMSNLTEHAIEDKDSKSVNQPARKETPSDTNDGTDGGRLVKDLKQKENCSQTKIEGEPADQTSKPKKAERPKKRLATSKLDEILKKNDKLLGDFKRIAKGKDQHKKGDEQQTKADDKEQRSSPDTTYNASDSSSKKQPDDIDKNSSTLKRQTSHGHLEHTVKKTNSSDSNSKTSIREEDQSRSNTSRKDMADSKTSSQKSTGADDKKDNASKKSHNHVDDMNKNSAHNSQERLDNSKAKIVAKESRRRCRTAKKETVDDFNNVCGTKQASGDLKDNEDDCSQNASIKTEGESSSLKSSRTMADDDERKVIDSQEENAEKTMVRAGQARAVRRKAGRVHESVEKETKSSISTTEKARARSKRGCSKQTSSLDQNGKHELLTEQEVVDKTVDHEEPQVEKDETPERKKGSSPSRKAVRLQGRKPSKNLSKSKTAERSDEDDDRSASEMDNRGSRHQRRNREDQLEEKVDRKIVCGDKSKKETLIRGKEVDKEVVSEDNQTTKSKVNDEDNKHVDNSGRSTRRVNARGKRLTDKQQKKDESIVFVTQSREPTPKIFKLAVLKSNRSDPKRAKVTSNEDEGQDDADAVGEDSEIFYPTTKRRARRSGHSAKDDKKDQESQERPSVKSRCIPDKDDDISSVEPRRGNRFRQSRAQLENPFIEPQNKVKLVWLSPSKCIEPEEDPTGKRPKSVAGVKRGRRQQAEKPVANGDPGAEGGQEDAKKNLTKATSAKRRKENKETTTSTARGNSQRASRKRDTEELSQDLTIIAPHCEEGTVINKRFKRLKAKEERPASVPEKAAVSPSTTGVQRKRVSRRRLKD